MGSKLPTGDRLLALKERTGLSLKAIAKACGYAGSSSIQDYFNASFNGQYLKSEVAEKLITGLVGKGVPPIQEREILELTAYRPSPPSPQVISATLAQSFVWHIAQRFGVELDLDDPEVIKLGKLLQALLKLSVSRQVSDADDLIAGLLAGLDIQDQNESGH